MLRWGRKIAEASSAEWNCMSALQGKTAFITGAASGIGRASALLFAASGAAVVALDRAPEVAATVEAINAAGGRAIALIKDSSAEEDGGQRVRWSRRLFCQRRNQRWPDTVLRGDGRALDADSPGQPGRRVSRREIRGAGNDPSSARVHHLYGLGRRVALWGRLYAL
jgi:hypothetical protein